MARSQESSAYPLETSIVYNRALDEVCASDSIRLILVGDNPGKDEQRAHNRRYLVGQAGKLAEGFFRKNTELNTDFRKDVIILNKTPIHTAKTRQLALLSRSGGIQFQQFFDKTLVWMARETATLRQKLGCGLWIVGYSELRPKGLFAAYARELGEACSTAQKSDGDEILLFQHFSMNRFSIDLHERYEADRTLSENLAATGIAHRKEVLGW